MPKTHLYITLGLVLSAAVFTCPLPRAQAQSKDETNCVTQERRFFFLTAIDRNGNMIDRLRKEDLSLKVGNSQAPIIDATFQAAPALDLAVLIDTSVSQEDVLPSVKTEAKTLITSLLRPNQDRVGLVSFSDKPKYDRLLTSEIDEVALAVDQIKLDIPPGYIGGGVALLRVPTKGPTVGSTSLWDATRSAIEKLFEPGVEKRRRAIVLFTNGEDTSSKSKLNSAIEEAIKHDVAVFSIGVTDSNFDVAREPLKKLSEQTGGIASFPGKKEGLASAFAEIASRLRGQFLIGYCAALDDRAKLHVKVINPEIRKARPVLAYRRY